MVFIKKHLLFTSTVLGVVIGYAVLHPFGMIVHAFFHLHKDEGYLHLHWDEIVAAFTKAFSLEHLPVAISYVILSGIIGYLFGKTISAQRVINEHLKTFSAIGVNASSIIHDLSNPLAGIMATIYLLKSKIKDPLQIDYCEIIERGTKRLSKMIMDIKINAQSMRAIELSKVPTDLKGFLENIVAEMRFSHEIKIASDIEERVLIDKNYMERAVWNLLKNADEALGGIKNGRVEISAGREDNSVIICIADNGPGISRGKLKYLFELGHAFGKEYGSGIGLYNCKKIIEAHGGKIWIVSRIGEGTKVYIKIPR